ncbi:hypothetical protein TELCIR_00856 [Teladorsagia circumcincta]|uniref:Uncharacterized protein n=1 Tax=Teladorsagia circumcincta TaxID=45464 RepID=A0A2G9V519_TELCI|nr:hypothetical protein TELCIR_00856 [Teladorsagia circumcincta]
MVIWKWRVKSGKIAKERRCEESETLEAVYESRWLKVKPVGLKGTNGTIKSKGKVESIFDTCPLILFNHLDKELLPFHHPNYTPKAGCRIYEPLTKLIKGRVEVSGNSSKHNCTARCLLPLKKDRTYNATSWLKVPSPKIFECDIIETQCEKGGVYESFLHTQIYEQRSLPKTIKYLKGELGAIQMEFLNKVGDNSRPNGFPLAFGKSIEGGARDLVGLPPLIPDWNDAEICGKYLDQFSYHLKDYKEMGYKTMIAQDFDVGIIYYPNCLGFNRSEADHIWRPFDLRARESKNFTKSLWQSCSEPHLEMMDYMEKFMHSYPGTPKIAQIWPTTLAHESLKALYHADKHFHKYFQKNRAVIDRSFMFFMGDHGPRREGIGKVRLGQYENLNPFLMVTIPSAYRNTSLHEQLRQKTFELMTNFDVHATLMDILKASSIKQLLDHGDILYEVIVYLTPSNGLFSCQELLDDFRCPKKNQYHEDFPIEPRKRTGRPRTKNTPRAFIRRNESGLALGSGFTRLDRYGRQGDCLVGNNPLRGPYDQLEERIVSVSYPHHDFRDCSKLCEKETTESRIFAGREWPQWCNGMISLRSIVLAVLFAAFLICAVDAKVLLPYDHEFYPGDYRLESFGDFLATHKRVPSAGDMMVRFGKRSV